MSPLDAIICGSAALFAVGLIALAAAAMIGPLK
jgi:hypothetical protein